MEKSQANIVDAIMEPIADSAESLSSTKSHYEEAEVRVLDLLLIIEQDYRSYYKVLLEELIVQRKATNELWNLTQRYMLATRTDPSCNCPTIYGVEPEEAIMANYNIPHKVLLVSNRALKIHLHSIRPNMLKLRRIRKELNLNQDTPFIQGDNFHQPVRFFFELVENIFKYFHSLYLKLDYSFGNLDPSDVAPLDEYMQLIKHNGEFEEYLIKGFSYCHCLQPLEQCPPKRIPVVQPPVPTAKDRKTRCLEKRDEMITRGSDRDLQTQSFDFKLKEILEGRGAKIVESILSRTEF